MPITSNPYWMLFTRESNGQWFPQFGDSSAKCVRDERKDSYREYASKNIRIIRFDHCPTTIEVMEKADAL